MAKLTANTPTGDNTLIPRLVRPRSFFEDLTGSFEDVARSYSGLIAREVGLRTKRGMLEDAYLFKQAERERFYSNLAAILNIGQSIFNVFMQAKINQYNLKQYESMMRGK